jgi:RimJ/RimL family protein N-acetyltransferase
MDHVHETQPALFTDRLVLRVHTLADFPDMATMWADPEVCRYIGGKPSTSEASSARFCRHRGLWDVLGYGFLAVCERATGAFVGEAGLFKRDLATSEVPEAGWVFTRAAAGRGYATEAMGAVLAWADARGRVPRTFCIIEPENRASIRVAEKCGYRDPRPIVHDDGVALLRFERSSDSAASVL